MVWGTTYLAGNCLELPDLKFEIDRGTKTPLPSPCTGSPQVAGPFQVHAKFPPLSIQRYKCVCLTDCAGLSFQTFKTTQIFHVSLRTSCGTWAHQPHARGEAIDQSANRKRMRHSMWVGIITQWFARSEA